MKICRSINQINANSTAILDGTNFLTTFCLSYQQNNKEDIVTNKREKQTSALACAERFIIIGTCLKVDCFLRGAIEAPSKVINLSYTGQPNLDRAKYALDLNSLAAVKPHRLLHVKNILMACFWFYHLGRQCPDQLTLLSDLSDAYLKSRSTIVCALREQMFARSTASRQYSTD